MVFNVDFGIWWMVGYLCYVLVRVCWGYIEGVWKCYFKLVVYLFFVVGLYGLMFLLLDGEICYFYEDFVLGFISYDDVIGFLEEEWVR